MVANGSKMGTESAILYDMECSVTNTRLSPRQARAVDFWVKNGRKSKAQALREVGYSEAIVHQPHKVFGSSAVQRELELRGLGKDGLCDGKPPQAEAVETATVRTDQPLFDPSLLTKEQLQWLKGQFAEIPEVPDPFVRREPYSNSIPLHRAYAEQECPEDVTYRNMSSL